MSDAWDEWGSIRFSTRLELEPLRVSKERNLAVFLSKKQPEHELVAWARVERADAPQMLPGLMSPIFVAFLESAATYLTSLLMLWISYVLNWNTQYILLDVGITFSMILLRLAIKDLAPAEDNLSTPNSYPLNGVAVARVVEVDDRRDLLTRGLRKACRIG
ncbi:hypothetical protein B0H14DRAFT_3734702 [Mycena olivaceomarginata]|nr:hypothetical protein B0H14DRAFT_3734702 [Mycena olivaceomarginata]